MIVKTWQIYGPHQEKENLAQRFVWETIQHIIKDTDIESFEGTTGRIKPHETIQKVMDEMQHEGIDYTTIQALSKFCTPHIEYIIKNGYQKWFDHILQYRDAEGERPLKFDTNLMKLTSKLQKEFEDSYMHKLGIKFGRN